MLGNLSPLLLLDRRSIQDFDVLIVFAPTAARRVTRRKKISSGSYGLACFLLLLLFLLVRPTPLLRFSVQHLPLARLSWPAWAGRYGRLNSRVRSPLLRRRFAWYYSIFNSGKRTAPVATFRQLHLRRGRTSAAGWLNGCGCSAAFVSASLLATIPSGGDFG